MRVNAFKIKHIFAFTLTEDNRDHAPQSKNIKTPLRYLCLSPNFS